MCCSPRKTAGSGKTFFDAHSHQLCRLSRWVDYTRCVCLRGRVFDVDKGFISLDFWLFFTPEFSPEKTVKVELTWLLTALKNPIAQTLLVAGGVIVATHIGCFPPAVFKALGARL